jgi:short-subunit dehydrogenase
VRPLHEGSAFAERYGPWAVVAGGSDGIGAAFARDLARRGLNVALIARREGPLEATAKSLREEFGVETRTLSVDLTAADGADTIARETAELDVGLFIYNAGANRVMKKFVDLPLEEVLFMLHLNCRGPLLLAKHFAPRLKARGRGGLVFMSSLACIAGSAYGAIYAATKSFDTILAEGLWHELAPEGVDVLGVIAGATKTESMLHDSENFADAMDPMLVAAGALDHLGKGPNWVPGDENRAAARGMLPVPRVALVNGMSQATAALFDLPHTPVEGREFHED